MRFRTMTSRSEPKASAVTDRALDILLAGLERRAEQMEKTLAAVAVELRGVQERQQVIRELLQAVKDQK